MPRCKFIHNLPCEQVSDRIVELEEENARLRSCLSDDAENARQIMGENAKMREQIHWLKKGDVLHVLTDQELADQQRHEREMLASIDALNADNNMLREMLSESRQANEHIFTELKRYKAVIRTRPIAMNALFDENAKLRELVKNLHACNGSCPRCIELMGRCEYEEQLAECGIEADE